MKTSTYPVSPVDQASVFQLAAQLEGSEVPKVFLQSFAERVFTILRADAAIASLNKKVSAKVSQPAGNGSGQF
jgi:hypothetical protein